MRLDTQAPASSDRAAPSGRAGLPHFFAGMTATARSALEDAIDDPGGLILIAGPAGSGRSTTVRGLLTARPDALAAGAIDCAERASRALQAARGRLVLATLTAPDAVAAVARMAALRGERFPIACALRLVMAQRRLRRLCPACRLPVQPANSVTAPLGLEPGAVVYRAGGCAACDGSGFNGSLGAFEILPVDSNVGRLIVCGADDSAIANHAFRTWPNLAAAVRALVAKGFATAEDAIALLRSQRQ